MARTLKPDRSISPVSFKACCRCIFDTCMSVHKVNTSTSNIEEDAGHISCRGRTAKNHCTSYSAA
jgi:hypothetical protein